MSNPRDFDGFYAIYYHGSAGLGLAQIQLHDGKIVGADVTGGVWDGEFVVNSVEQLITCNVTIQLPEGVALATTGKVPKGNEARNMAFKLPFDFMTREYVALDLPIGKINVRFKRLR